MDPTASSDPPQQTTPSEEVPSEQKEVVAKAEVLATIKKREPLDHPVRWGIVSTAEICGKVVPALQKCENSTVVAVASRSSEKAEEFAKKCGIAKACGSYDDLLQRDDVDAVYIPLPTGFKREWVLRAAQLGKHVLVEKPLPGSNSDVKSMTAACEKENVQFMDGTHWVHSKRTQEIENKFLATGKLGRIRHITASFTFAAPNEEWLQGGNGRTDKTREPMGTFGDAGWYPIRATLWAKGYELPVRVQMTSWTENKVNTIIDATGFLWFKDGSTASFDCGVTTSHRSFVEIAGDQGRVLINDLVGGQGRTGDFLAYFLPFEGSEEYVYGDASGKDEVVKVAAGKSDHVLCMVEHFVQHVKAGEISTKWPQQSLATHATMAALWSSYEQGGKIVHL